MERRRSHTSGPCRRARSRRGCAASSGSPNPRSRTSARTVAEVLADLATEPGPAGEPVTEVAGPREESLVEMAMLLTARRGHPVKIEGVSDPADPDRELNVNGATLPGPGAILAGPTFQEWLDSEF